MGEVSAEICKAYKMWDFSHSLLKMTLVFLDSIVRGEISFCVDYYHYYFFCPVCCFFSQYVSRYLGKSFIIVVNVVRTDATHLLLHLKEGAERSNKGILRSNDDDSLFQHPSFFSFPASVSNVFCLCLLSNS